MSRAINIDIDEELKAMKEGQCGMCRIGATHKRNPDCINTPESKYVMRDCEVCGHRFCVDFFSECPICKNNLYEGEKWETHLK